jgi:hypothetical protein
VRLIPWLFILMSQISAAQYPYKERSDCIFGTIENSSMTNFDMCEPNMARRIVELRMFLAKS